MTVLIEDGAMIITKGGNTVLNSNDKLFHRITQLNGTVAIPGYSNPDDTNANVTQSYDLGAVNALCSDVIGAMKFSGYAYSSGLANSRWTTVMGGSLLWVIDGHAPVDANPDPNGTINQMCFFNLRFASGHLYLDRHLLFNSNGQGVYSILSHSIEYKLQCGVWT